MTLLTRSHMYIKRLGLLWDYSFLTDLYFSDITTQLLQRSIPTKLTTNMTDRRTSSIERVSLSSSPIRDDDMTMSDSPIDEVEATHAAEHALEVRFGAYELCNNASRLEIDAVLATLAASRARLRADQAAWDCLDAENTAADLAGQANHVPGDDLVPAETLYRNVVEAGLQAADGARAVLDLMQQAEVADRTRVIRARGQEIPEDLRGQAEAADRVRMEDRTHPGGNPGESDLDRIIREGDENMADILLIGAETLANRNLGRYPRATPETLATADVPLPPNIFTAAPETLATDDAPPRSNIYTVLAEHDHHLLLTRVRRVRDTFDNFRTNPQLLESLEYDYDDNPIMPRSPESPRQGLFESTADVHTYLSLLPRPALSELDEYNRTCHICMEPFTTDGPTVYTGEGETLDESQPEIPLRLPCEHVLGDKCLFKWLSPLENSNCPYCRRSVLEDNENDHDNDQNDQD